MHGRDHTASLELEMRESRKVAQVRDQRADVDSAVVEDEVDETMCVGWGANGEKV